jgi:hypothetical protein
LNRRGSPSSWPPRTGLVPARRRWMPSGGRGSVAGGRTGGGRVTSQGEATTAATRCCSGRSTSIRSANGCGCPLHDGSQRPCSWLMAPGYRVPRGHRKARGGARCVPPCGCIPGAIAGGSGRSQACPGAAMPMTGWPSGRPRTRPKSSQPRWRYGGQRAAEHGIQTRLGGWTARTAVGQGRSRTGSVTASGPPCGHGWCSIANAIASL